RPSWGWCWKLRLRDYNARRVISPASPCVFRASTGYAGISRRGKLTGWRHSSTCCGGESMLQWPPVEAIMADNQVARWTGGSPLAVLGRLILLSILVGVILSALGLDPFDILHSVERLIRSIWNMGFDAIRWMWRYFLLGAVIVIPIWILMRLFNAPRGKGAEALARLAFGRDRSRIVADHRRE